MASLYKVMVVDDEMLIRQGILHYIDWPQEGFDIVGEASNGREALALIPRVKPDIIITDIVMPVMNGTDFIRTVKQDYPEIEVIVLSSFGDFDYVRSTFQSGVADYILKPKLDSSLLLSTLRRVEEQRFTGKKRLNLHATAEKKSVQTLTEKAIAGYSTIDERNQLAALLSKPVICFAELVNFDNIDMDAYLDVTREKWPVLNFFVIKSSLKKRLLLLNTNQADFDKWTYNLNQNDIQEPLGITWLITTPFKKVDQLKLSHDEQLIKLRQYLFYLADQPLLYFGQLPEEQVVKELFDLNYFIELFKHKKFDSAFHYVNKHINQLKNQYSYDENEVKSFLGNVIFNITVLMGILKYDTKTFEKDKYAYFNTINNAETIQEALRPFDQFLLAVQETLKTAEDLSSQANMMMLFRYIDQNYTEQLSLTELANHFHFNPSYLSSYFSTHHNLGFSEYLTQIRLNKAKELLQNSDISISDIGGMVGYGDHSYFCKVFKKNVNRSPSNYRKDVVK